MASISRPDAPRETRCTKNYPTQDGSPSSPNGIGLVPTTRNRRFATAQTYAAGSGSNAIAVGDFFGNGQLDLAVANTGDGTLSFLANNGAGHFAAPMTVSIGAPTFYYYIAAGAFNRDGRTDIAVADFNTGTVAVFRNNGGGNFTRNDIAVGGGPDAIAVGDVNGDGQLDLVVSSYYTNTATELIGNGDATFYSSTVFSTGSGGPNGVALDDFNRDGSLDVAVALQDAGQVAVFKSNTVSAVEGQPLQNAVLARFFDTAGAELSGGTHYTATIYWGDGHSDTGLVTYEGNQTFDVTGPAHVHAAEGRYFIQVVVNHETAPALTLTTPIQILEGDLAVNVQSVTATEASSSAARSRPLPTTTRPMSRRRTWPTPTSRATASNSMPSRERRSMALWDHSSMPIQMPRPATSSERFTGKPESPRSARSSSAGEAPGT